jgi:YHS domain-containing protein
MKILIPTCLSILFLSCQNQQSSGPAGATPAAAQQPAKPKYTINMLDNKNDLSCGMPLTAGIEDTVHYKGKVYGFCSKDCKDDFQKDPEGHLAYK